MLIKSMCARRERHLFSTMAGRGVECLGQSSQVTSCINVLHSHLEVDRICKIHQHPKTKRYIMLSDCFICLYSRMEVELHTFASEWVVEPTG